MSKQKIELSVPMTFAGVNYEAGLIEMPEAAAKSAIKRKFGKAADADDSVETKGAPSDSADENFEPLSFEETMSRFNKIDFSDEVMKSLQYHEKTVKEFRASGMSEEDFLKKQKADEEAVQKLPLNFPMRHVYVKLGSDYDSVEKIQAFSFEDLVKITGIAEPTAKKALEYKREK